MVLYDLVVNCEYGTMKHQMIRDRLVVSIQDDVLSQKLQMDTIHSQQSQEASPAEGSCAQQQVLRGVSNTSTEVEAVRSNPRCSN